MSWWGSPKRQPRSGVHDWAADSGGASTISFNTVGSNVAPDMSKVAKPKRVVAEHGEHTLICIKTSNNYYDEHGIHGRFYICKSKSDADAIARWHGWLRSQGVDV